MAAKKNKMVETWIGNVNSCVVQSLSPVVNHVAKKWLREVIAGTWDRLWAQGLFCHMHVAPSAGQTPFFNKTDPGPARDHL
jgi:hypothetical protein